MWLQDKAEKAGVPVVTWDSMISFGKSNPTDATPGKLDDLCTIMCASDFLHACGMHGSAFAHG